MNAWQQRQTRVACPTCGAEPGDRCRTRSGRDSQYQHADRARAADQLELLEGVRR